MVETFIRFSNKSINDWKFELYLLLIQFFGSILIDCTIDFFTRTREVMAKHVCSEKTVFTSII